MLIDPARNSSDPPPIGLIRDPKSTFAVSTYGANPAGDTTPLRTVTVAVKVLRFSAHETVLHWLAGSSSSPMC